MFSTTSPAITGINPGNFCKGVGNVVIDGSPCGMVKAETEVRLLQENTADVRVRCAQYDGDVLGLRRGGSVYQLQFELSDSNLGNYKMLLDTQALLSGGALNLGRSNKVATTHEVRFYGVGPDQRTRIWTFWRCFAERTPDLLLGSETEPNSLQITLTACRVPGYAEEFCYGNVSDYDLS